MPEGLTRPLYTDIARDIDNGAYFSDAKEWYRHKYLYPVIERSFFILLTLAALFVSITAIFVLFNFLPLVKKVPIFVGIQNPELQYPRIVYLGGEEANREIDPDLVLRTYLLRKFVQAYEAYDYKDDFEKLKKNLNFIEQFSAPEMLSAYKFYISIRNPKSIILKFRNHTQRDIEVNALVLYQKEDEANTANVYQEYREFLKIPENLGADEQLALVDFTSIETSAAGKKSTRWKGKILFRYSNLVYDREKSAFKPIDLKVMDYQAVEMTQ